jgi:hypothetical protein
MSTPKHSFSQPYRFEAAKAAMQGLLADPEDHEGSRRVFYSDGTHRNIGTRWELPAHLRPAIVHTETCTEAVARLAVEQADCLLAELERTYEEPDEIKAYEEPRTLVDGSPVDRPIGWQDL